MASLDDTRSALFFLLSSVYCCSSLSMLTNLSFFLPLLVNAVGGARVRGHPFACIVVVSAMVAVCWSPEEDCRGSRLTRREKTMTMICDALVG